MGGAAAAVVVCRLLAVGRSDGVTGARFRSVLQSQGKINCGPPARPGGFAFISRPPWLAKLKKYVCVLLLISLRTKNSI